MQPYLPNFLAKWVGGWVKAHISSQKILSQKEAELVLARKRNQMVSLAITRLRLRTPNHWVHLCIYLLSCFESINQNL